MAQVLNVALPAQAAAGADATTEIGEVSTVSGTDNYLTRAEIVPPPGYTTSTANATNYVTFTLRQLRAGSVLVANLASFSSTAVSVVAETPIPLVINATTAQQSGLQQGDVLDVLMHQVGAGVTVGASLVAEVELS